MQPPLNVLTQRVMHVLEFELGDEVKTPFRFVCVDEYGGPPTRADIFKALDFGSEEIALAFAQRHMQDTVYPVHYRAVEMTAVYL